MREGKSSVSENICITLMVILIIKYLILFLLHVLKMTNFEIYLHVGSELRPRKVLLQIRLHYTMIFNFSKSFEF